MRTELENIALVVRYMQGEMSNAEKLEFEKELSVNAQLKETLQEQRALYEGVVRAQFRVKVAAAAKSYRRRLWLRYALIAATILAAAFVVWKGFSSEKPTTVLPQQQIAPTAPEAAPMDSLSTTTMPSAADSLYEGGNTPEKPKTPSFNMLKETSPDTGRANPFVEPIQSKRVEQAENWSTWKERTLSPQTFEVSTTQNNVLLTKEGVVIAIPAAAFNTSAASVKLQIVEAITAQQIMLAALSTQSGKEDLATGGMIELHAYDDQGEVEVVKDILVDMPVNEIDPNMMHYTGVKDAQGKIDWVDPQPVENFLTNVPMLELDFYPPDYLDGLCKQGFDCKNKHFADSMFYSLELTKASTSNRPDPPLTDRPPRRNRRQVEQGSMTNGTISDVATLEIQQLEYSFLELNPGYENWIMPSSIRAIWNDKFNGTLLATREFEERLRVIYRDCNARALFNVYLNGLNEEMWKLDEQAAQLARSEGVASRMKKFAQEKKGRTRPLDDGAYAALNEFYTLQQSAYRKAALSEVSNLNKKYDQLTREKWYDANANQLLLAEEQGRLFSAEYDMTYREVCRQLGIEPYPQTRVLSKQRLTMVVRGGGWHNLDALVSRSVLWRQSFSYSNEVTGKKAVINYSNFQLRVIGEDQCEEVLVYCLGSKLRSFVRLYRSGDSYTYSLNELESYSLVVMGYSGDKYFSAKMSTINAGKAEVTLEECSQSDLQSLIAQYDFSDREVGIQSQVDFMVRQRALSNQIKTISLQLADRRRMLRYVYECYSPAESYEGPIEGKQ